LRSSWVQWKYTAKSQVVFTSVSQLKSLGARAKDGYQIHVEAVNAGRSAPGGNMCFVDATGGIELGDIEGTETLAIGQKVLIAGTITKTGQQVSLNQIWMTMRAPPTNSNPELIPLEHPLAQGDNLKWVQIEGEIQYRHSSSNEFAFDLADGAASMHVHLLCPTGSLSLPSSGARVSVRGICLGAYNDQGQWVASDLWAAGWDSLNIVAAPTHNPLLTVHRRQTASVAASSTNLTTIEQIRHLPPDQINAHPRVKIRAIITGFLEGFVQDDTGGIEVRFSSDESRKLTEMADYIEVDGTAELDEVGNPQISADHVTVLGKGKLPPPQRLTLSQLMSGRMEGQWIEIEGVVHSTDGAHMLLISYGRELMASLALAQTEVVKGLVDAEVRVRGVGVTAMDEQGRIQGIHLLIPSFDDVEVLEPPSDPRQLPVRPLGSLLGLSGPRESFHRVKVAGVVTLCDAHRLFLQDDTGSAMAIFKEEVRLDANFGRSHWLYWRTSETNAASPYSAQLAPGDRVEVVGFPETRRYSPVLTEVMVTKLATHAVPKTDDLTAKGIEEGGLDSSLVTFDGVLRARNAVGGNIVLTFDWRDRSLQVIVPEKEADVLDISLDSSVRVTGICQVDPSPFAELGLRAAAVRILVRTAGDLTVLEEPSWWNIERALMLVGGMALAILAALIWIKELRRQVGERTVQLTAEVRLREQTERQHALDQERARIAKDLHDDLGANLTQIVFLCQRVEVTRNEDGKEVSHWFNLIPETARRTIQSLDEIVWAINPRHDSLESLANYLSQFAQEHLTLAQVRCVLDVPMVLPTLALTAEVRHNLLLTVREALQNVVNHSAATEVQLTLKLVDEGISIKITDDGKGFEVAKASSDGNGLHNMRRRLEEIGGKFEINSQPGKGTTVSLFVPPTALHGRVIGEPAAQGQDL
jgi:signal transduction histidine kinase